MSCDETEALRAKIDVLQALKDRAETERDAVKRELEMILAVRRQHRERIRLHRERILKEVVLREEARQLIADIADLLDPRVEGNASALARIAAARAHWAEERHKPSGG